MRLRLLGSLVVLFSSIFCLQGQSTSAFDVSLEFQAYPTGLIPGVRFAYLFQEKNAVHTRLGYNWVRHGDAGVQEDERGDGFGFTIGYNRFFSENYRNWMLGVRNDLWFNTLDWKNNIGTPLEAAGTSEIIVLQPTLEGGYRLAWGDDWFFTPTVAFGTEINIKTTGAPVGEGLILLAGISIGKTFR